MTYCGRQAQKQDVGDSADVTSVSVDDRSSGLSLRQLEMGLRLAWARVQGA